MKSIANICNVCSSSIRYWLFKSKINIKNKFEAHSTRRHKKFNKNWLFNLYIIKRKSTLYISKITKCSDRTIRAWLMKDNLIAQSHNIYILHNSYFSMTFNIKRGRGRPKVLYKSRSFLYVSPKGFSLYEVDTKNQKFIFKRDGINK
jgi:hypothetical protein